MNKISNVKDGVMTKAKANRLSAQAFIEIWQTASSLAEVTARSGLKKMSAQQRAVHYRQKGIPLKKYKTGKFLDVNTLKKLAVSLT